MRFRRTPLAWRSITHNRKRFIPSLAGMTFAVILMFVQLGFLNVVSDSQVEFLKRLNADLVMLNWSKHHMAIDEPFPRRRLEQARGVAAVAAVYPIYIEGSRSLWKNAETRQLRLIRVVGIDPADPALLHTSLDEFAGALRQEDAALMDVKSKAFLGPRDPGTRTELAGHRIRIVGNFSLGTDFDFDGTVILSESNFLKLFPSQQTSSDPQLARVHLGLIRLRPDASLMTARREIEAVLPPDVRVLTKAELLDLETDFWQNHTPVGFVFGLGVAIGFAVGVVICSQILYTSVLDRMPLFGTLKAIGYTNRYLVRLVGGEALLLSLLAFVPGLAIASMLYAFLSSMIGFVMFLTPPRVLLVLVMTTGMSMAAAFIALRKALTADPAEVFK